MAEVSFPGGLSEIEFVAAYARSALRRPQVAADAALRSLVFAELSERPVLAGLIACELAEACRRLTAVYRALADRRFSVGRSLVQPLPGVLEWRELVHEAGTFTPEQIVRELSLGEEALDHAARLRGQPSLADLDRLVAAAEQGNALVLVPFPQRSQDEEVSIAGIDREGDLVSANFGTGEGVAACLTDLTADLCGIARGFLESYVHGRRTAGRRE